MKNKIMLLILGILLVSTVNSLDVSTTYDLINPETAKIYFSINETSTINIYIGTDYNLTNLIASAEFPVNDTKLEYTISILEADTTYYVRLNGTTEGEDSQQWYTTIGEFKTDEYLVKENTIRVLIGLILIVFEITMMFTLIIKSFYSFGVTKEFIKYVLNLIVGTIILIGITSAVLIA